MATTITPIKNEEINGINKFLALAFGRAFSVGTEVSIGGSTYKCLTPAKIYQVNTKDLNQADLEFNIQCLIVERDDGFIYEIRASDLANPMMVRQRAANGVDLFSDAKMARYGYCLSYHQELLHQRNAPGVMEFSMDLALTRMIDGLAADISTFIKGINGQVEEIVLPA